MTLVVDHEALRFNKFIKYRGVLDFQSLYRYTRKWLLDRDWDFYDFFNTLCFMGLQGFPAQLANVAAMEVI